MCLEQLEQKIEKIESKIDKSSSDNVEETIYIVEERIRQIDDSVEEIEILNKNFIKFLESKDSKSLDYLAQEDNLNHLIKLQDKFVVWLTKEYETIKRNDSLSAITDTISPRLLMRIENVVEELDDLTENIKLGLKYHEDFDELEELVKEYGKSAKVVDLEKKIA